MVDIDWRTAATVKEPRKGIFNWDAKSDLMRFQDNRSGLDSAKSDLKTDPHLCLDTIQVAATNGNLDYVRQITEDREADVVNCVNLPVSHGAKVNEIQAFGKTAFHFATENRQLVDLDANINHPDTCGRTVSVILESVCLKMN